MTFVSELEPKELWRHFDHILTIPRGSGNEGAVRDYVTSIARQRSLETIQDDAGNLVIRKPATAGHEQVGEVVLQCHLDMVNEKNADVEHDFSCDPIKPKRDGEYLTAEGTTLGSDNGIGIAAALAVLENDSLQHGPVEALFTVDEETGLTGASGLSSEILQGSYLINLDSEEQGALYVGCAGGAGVDLVLPLQWIGARKDQEALVFSVGGLRGGHSGIDIHLQRGNAICILARCLNAVHSDHGFQLADIRGGNMHNAIPRESEAQLLMAKAGVELLRKDLKEVFQNVVAEFNRTDPGIEMNLDTAQPPSSTFDSETTAKVLDLLCSLPHGVATLSNDIPGLVETSSNLATVWVEGEDLLMHVSNRSSVDSALSWVQQRAIAIGRLAGAEAQWVEGYPGWQPDMESPLLKLVQKVHIETLGFAPDSKAVHAGLECGIIKQKYPTMDVISFGPQIEFPHSPDERVEIASVAAFYKLLVSVLKEVGRT